MTKAISHVVKRSGRKPGDPEVEIPVAEDLATVPGIPSREDDVSFYNRVYPLESYNVDTNSVIEWQQSFFTPEFVAYRKRHNKALKPILDAAEASGELEPTGTPEPGRDVSEDIRTHAQEMGFGEVGFTRFDRRYVFSSKKRWVKYDHAICLAFEQDYDDTQTIPVSRPPRPWENSTSWRGSWP